MNSYIKISKISKKFNYLSPFIQTGTIISVFDKVINIMTERGLFAIQESSIPITPFTIFLDKSFSIKDLRLEPNDKVSFRNGFISTGELVFSMENAEVVDTTIKHLIDDTIFRTKINWLIDILSSILVNGLGNNQNKSGLLDLSVHIHLKDNYISVDDNYFKTNLLNYLKDKFHKKDAFSAEFPTELASLVGLGDGLTPSFDDFLVGLLSILKFVECKSDKLQSLEDSLSRIIRSNLSTTTVVSSAFLESAIENQFSQPLLNFYNSIIDFDGDNIKKALEDITRIGHSSGVDSLNGILFGLRLINATI